MSSRIIESMGTDCVGGLSCRRRLGWLGCCEPAGRTKKALMINTAIPATDRALLTRHPKEGEKPPLL
jgi:hypothetical protein